jgi:resuscitation-promoting factor RpfA
MNRPSEPFNAEERDLAQRLARSGGPREPAPALDAIILAAARAAVSEDSAPAATPVSDPSMPADPKVTPLRPRKPTPRWPLGMGLAASLVLAAGIGWRLQGDGDGSSQDSSPVSLPAAVYHEEATEAVILEPPMERTPPPPPPPLGATADATARRADVAQAPMAKAVPAPSEPDFAADAPLAEAVAAAPSPPPASAPVAAAASNGIAADAALDKVTVTGSRIGVEREVGAAEYTRTPLEERRQQVTSQPASKAAAATSATAAPAPSIQTERARGAVGNTAADGLERKERDSGKYDDRPPVSADSPEFRQAWLQRIRGHIAKGESDAARSSLQEFRRRYPDVELPEDLRKLAATLPTP